MHSSLKFVILYSPVISLASRVNELPRRSHWSHFYLILGGCGNRITMPLMFILPPLLKQASLPFDHEVRLSPIYCKSTNLSGHLFPL